MRALRPELPHAGPPGCPATMPPPPHRRGRRDTPLDRRIHRSSSCGRGESIERERSAEKWSNMRTRPREVAWTYYCPYFCSSLCLRSSLAVGYSWRYGTMAPASKATRTRWQITNLPILRTLPEVNINDRPRSSAGARYRRQRGYAFRRNPLNFLAPRPGLEPGTYTTAAARRIEPERRGRRLALAGLHNRRHTLCPRRERNVE